MEIALDNVFSVTVPEKDRAFFRSMARHMGWRTKLVRKAAEEQPEYLPALERALEDVRRGNVYHSVSHEDLMAQLEAD